MAGVRGRRTEDGEQKIRRLEGKKVGRRDIGRIKMGQQRSEDGEQKIRR